MRNGDYIEVEVKDGKSLYTCPVCGADSNHIGFGGEEWGKDYLDDNQSCSKCGSSWQHEYVYVKTFIKEVGKEDMNE